MNKFGKIAAIVGACLLAFGAICLFIGRLIGGVTTFSYVVGKNGAVVTDNNVITETVDLEPFDELIIDVASIDVEVVKGDDYKFEMCVPEELKAEITQNNNSLKIKEPKINFSFNFNTNNLTQHIYYKVFVPDTDVIKTEITSTSGDILVSDVNPSGKIIMTSGDGKITNIESDNLNVQATSGEIEIENGNIDNLNIETTSGDVNLKDVNSEKIKSHTTSGEIVYNNVSTDEMTSVSTSGDFDGSGIKAEVINVTCTSGEVELDIVGKQSEYDYQIHTTSGDIKVGTVKTEHEYSTKENTGREICVDATSGNVSIDFAD